MFVLLVVVGFSSLTERIVSGEMNVDGMSLGWGGVLWIRGVVWSALDMDS